MNNIEKIKVISKKYLDKDLPENLESSFDSLLFDEIDKIELVMRIEEEFDVQINDDLADSFISFKDILKFLENSNDK